MSTTHRSDGPLLAGYHHSGDRGLGLLAQTFPGTGQHGPSLPFPGLVFPADNGKEIICRILTVPPLLTLFAVDELGRVDAEGPDGVHPGLAEGFADGTSYETYPFEVLIGAGVLTGVVTGGDAVASGVLSPAPPGQLAGGVTADDAVPSGTLTLMPAAPAPTPFMPQRQVTLMYSVLDPSATPDLTSKDPAEDVMLVADFTPFASVTNPVWSIVRVGGDDGTTPMTTVGGSAIVGGRVTQQAEGGASGNTYAVRCNATGPGGVTLIAAGRLPVRTR